MGNAGLYLWRFIHIMKIGSRRWLRTFFMAVLFLMVIPFRASAEVSVTTEELSLETGQTFQLGLDGLTGAETSIAWKVKKKAVADVSESGLVTAKAAGSTRIYAVVDGTQYSCRLTVTEPTVTVQLNKTKKTLQKGKTYRLRATVSPEWVTNAAVGWKSSNKKVARVNSRGKVTAVGAGTAKITAYAKDGSGAKAVCRITVKRENVSLNMTELSLEAGKKIKLKVTPATDDSTYVWATSDKSVATVTKTGRIKGKREGSAVIVARRVEDGKSAQCYVTVTSPQEETQEETPEETTVPQQPSAGALQLMALLQKYSDQVAADKAAGIRWEYSNSAQNTWKKAYKASRKKGVTYVNCALTSRWALRELGILNTDNFWGAAGGGIVFRGTSKEQLLEHCEIIPVFKTPDELIAAGNLLPGDICTYVEYQHTNVYAGDGLWYDSGRSGAAGGYVDGKYVFDSFGPAATVNMSGTHIGNIIRIVR